MKMTNCFARSFLVMGLMAAALGLAACGGSGEDVVKQAPPVTVAAPTRMSVRSYMIFTGSTRAVESADVVARVVGTLETVEFNVSSEVTEGQLLFTIEDTKYRAARDAAAATVQSAEADLLRSRTELRRVEKASQSRAVSEMDVDRARANRDMAEAAVAAAEANLAEAELNLSYTQVVAPISGVASRNLVDAGNLVGQSGPTLLTRINKLKPIYVYFHAPESLVLQYLSEMENIKNGGEQRGDGGEAFVARATDEGFPFPGVIDFIDNEVDPNTGTIELRVRLDNENGDFFPGLFVRVKVLARTIPDAVLVPEVALGTDLGGKYILVVGENNIVEQKYVSLGLPEDGGLIHIKEGLTGDETIIVNGLMFARPGLPVTPLTAEEFAAMQKQAAAGN